MTKPKIAVFSGPTATIQNSEPLVTSNKARARHGLPLRLNPDGSPMRFDALRPQRLAAPVTLYVEQFSAHPLEGDAAELYGPPDGYLDASGAFHRERQGPDDVGVYEVTLHPEDGLYPLPYMARQADGQAWEGDGVAPQAPAERSRQPFYPDGSRLFEEIDRLGIDEDGVANMLSSKAEFEFHRAAPSAGYKKGLPASARTDVGTGDIAPEAHGRDFFPYRPVHLRAEPPMATLARLTNVVQRALASGRYAGAIWLEGSPNVEETTYWLNLLIDTPVPVVGNASQRPHGAASNDGDRNIVDSVDYIVSRIWAGADGRDSVGAVVIQDEQIFTARDVQKADARPGGYVATGGHGGIVGSIGQPGPPVLTFRPVKRHTYTSSVRLSELPKTVEGTRRAGGQIGWVTVDVKDADGGLVLDRDPQGHDRQARALHPRRFVGRRRGRGRHPRPHRQEPARSAAGRLRRRGLGAVRLRAQRNGSRAPARDVQRDADREGRARKRRRHGRSRPLAAGHRRQQPHRHQGPAVVDGVPDEARERAAGRRPGQSHTRGDGRREGEAR